MADVNVNKNQIVDFMLVGAGSAVSLQDPDAPGYTLVHTTVATVEIMRVIGNTDVRITGGTFFKSVSVQ